jgi:hypothetical protein
LVPDDLTVTADEITVPFIVMALHSRGLVIDEEFINLLEESTNRMVEQMYMEAKMSLLGIPGLSKGKQTAISALLADLDRSIDWMRYPARAPALADQVKMGIITVERAAQLSARWARHVARMQANPGNNVTPIDGSRRKPKARPQ